MVVPFTRLEAVTHHRFPISEVRQTRSERYCVPRTYRFGSLWYVACAHPMLHTFHDVHAGVHHDQECYDLTESVLEWDPYALECLPAHLASAVELRKKNELFMRGHMCVSFN